MSLRLSRHLKHLTVSIVLISLAAGVMISTTSVLAGATGLPLSIDTACGCEGASEEALELSEGELPFEESFKFPAGAPPKPPLKFKIENVGPTNEVTLGVLALGGANAADYSENGGCNNAKLKPLGLNSCIDVIKLEKETGKTAEVTGEGTYANSGFKAKFKLNLSH